MFKVLRSVMIKKEETDSQPYDSPLQFPAEQFMKITFSPTLPGPGIVYLLS